MNSEYTPVDAHLYTDAATGVLKERRFKLTIKDGPDAGISRILDHGTLMIGQHRNNDLVLTDDTISRYHLEIQVRKTSLFITGVPGEIDSLLGSSRPNPTFSMSACGHSRPYV